jgi:hypothetical protein
MDTIWNCAFVSPLKLFQLAQNHSSVIFDLSVLKKGVDIDLQNNHDNEYYRRCETLFANTSRLNLVSKIGCNFF